jgi:hypothetical protein
MGTPSEPPLTNWNPNNIWWFQYQTFIFGMVKYMLLTLWMIHQYGCYAFLLTFFTILSIETYKKSLSKELVYNYKLKAELNKWLLMFQQAWGNDEDVKCYLLSANTNEVIDKWETFSNQFEEKLISDHNDLFDQLSKSNKEVQ